MVSPRLSLRKEYFKLYVTKYDFFMRTNYLLPNSNSNLSSFCYFVVLPYTTLEVRVKNTDLAQAKSETKAFRQKWPPTIPSTESPNPQIPIVAN